MTRTELSAIGSPAAQASSAASRSGCSLRRALLAIAARVACCAMALAGQNASSAEAEANAPAANVPPAAPAIDRVALGFAGSFKVGFWTPVEVLVRGGPQPLEATLDLVVVDGDGVPSRVRRPVRVEAGGRQVTRLEVKVGQPYAPIRFELRSGEQVISSLELSRDDPQLSGLLPSTRPLVVALGSPFVQTDTFTFEQRQLAVANVEEIDALPDHWFGYEGVDCVVLATHDAPFVARLLAAPTKLAALTQWVRLGGRLLLSVGSQAPAALAPGSPLAELVPGTFESLVPLRQSVAFETYVETGDVLDIAPGAPLQVPRLRGADGRIEAYSGSHARDLPLVVRHPLGFGEVTLLAADLALPPFDTWRSRPQLLDKLLRRSALADGLPQGTLGQVTTLGFEDLTGQLRGALDQFDGVTLVPFWLVAVLIFAYAVCIGPLDYLLVKRLLRRMEATWLTFALTVVLYSAGAYALAYGLKGDQLRIDRIDLVDVDTSSQLVRGTSWLNLFSPQTDTFDLTLRPEVAAAAAPPGVLLSWLGLPGSGFGGMDPAGASSSLAGGAWGGTTLFTEPYDFAPQLNALERLPIAVWSSKALVGRWWAEAPSAIEGNLTDQGKLTGTLTNRLDATIEEGVLLFDRWAYPIRDWRPGAALRVQSDLNQQTVDTYLRHVVVRGDRNVAPPYDRASFDVRRLVEVLSAHELAGGSKYTGLANDYQGFVDLSRLVQNRRAVLLGRVARRAVTLERDGRSLDDAPGGQWTFYRFVFPVEVPENNP